MRSISPYARTVVCIPSSKHTSALSRRFLRREMSPFHPFQSTEMRMDFYLVCHAVPLWHYMISSLIDLLHNIVEAGSSIPDYSKQRWPVWASLEKSFRLFEDSVSNQAKRSLNLDLLIVLCGNSRAIDARVLPAVDSVVFHHSYREHVIPFACATTLRYFINVWSGPSLLLPYIHPFVFTT